MFEWINDPGGRHIFWLSGLAGAGKSAIAMSVVQRCREEGTLAANFFFARARPASTHMEVFTPRVASELYDYFPSFRPLLTMLRQRVRASPPSPHPAVPASHPPFYHQLYELVIDPVLMLQNRGPRPAVVVVDALDECAEQDLVVDLVRLLAHALRDPRLPLLLFFTSRPEPHIRAAFTDPDVDAVTRALSLQDFDAQADIRVFLQHGFWKMVQERPWIMNSVRPPWPSDRDLDALVEQSSGLFIYASTILKFISDNGDDPFSRLKTVLDVNRGSSGSAFVGLDQLYTGILSAHYSDVTRLVLGTIILLFDPLPVEQIENLLGLESGDAWVALQGLHSVLLFPPEQNKPVRIYHASFHDFLTHPDRSHNFFIDPETQHVNMTYYCLALMVENLSRDVGNLEDPLAHGNHAGTPKRPPRHECISGALRYACRYWALHLSRVPFNEHLLSLLNEFGFRSILYWIEALSLIQDLEIAIPSLKCASWWISVSVPVKFLGACQIADCYSVRRYPTPSLTSSRCSTTPKHCSLNSPVPSLSHL